MVRPSEKKVLEELLRMYRATSCLWDPCHESYTNQAMRRKAIDILLVKYREMNPTASETKMSKKIQNMRTLYRKERIKVVRHQRAGEPYEPTLWYYPLMRFLDQLDPGLADEPGLDHTGDSGSEHHAGCDSPPYKKAKPSAVYITDEVHKEEPLTPAQVVKLRYSSDEDPPYVLQKEAPYLIQEEGQGPGAAGALFGRAMAARLDELRPQQRIIAEKLISDVIFLGRLNKLKTGSKIDVNDDSY